MNSEKPESPEQPESPKVPETPGLESKSTANLTPEELEQQADALFGAEQEQPANVIPKHEPTDDFLVGLGNPEDIAAAPVAPNTPTKVDGKPVSIRPILDEKGIATSYSVTLADGTTKEVPPGDPLLERSMPGRRYFIRSHLGNTGDLGERSVFELSRVEMGQDEDNRIIVEVNQIMPNGDPDPRYEKIMNAMKQQDSDFIGLKLAYNPSTNVYRVLECEVIPPYDFAAYHNPQAEKWIKTNSRELKEFTYTENLKDSCDVHGQWTIHKANIKTVAELRAPEAYDTFRGVVLSTAIDNLHHLMVARGQAEGLDQWDIQALSDKHTAQFRDFAANSKYFGSMDDMLHGRETTYEVGKPVERKVIYDLDSNLADQIETPVGTPDQINNSEYSQILNHAFQTALREKMIQENKINQVFAKANEDLVHGEVIPFIDPYRTQLDNQLLNQEFTEMVGSNLIMALMAHHDAKPRRDMPALHEGGSAHHLLNGVYALSEDGRAMSTDEFLGAAAREAQDTIDAHMAEIERIAEEEAYEPGKSPRAKAKKKADELNERRRMMGGLAAAGAAVSEDHLNTIEKIDLFH